MNIEPTNKRIWIIGASTGIGRALAIELDSQGAELILSARQADKLDSLKSELSGDHQTYPMDVSNYDDLKKFKSTILEQENTNKIECVIFLAAIYSPHSSEPKDIDFIHKMISVNLGGAFNVVDIMRPYFQGQKGGQIVLCGSVAGYRGLPNGQPYCATKAAIINMAESLKIECEKDNIDIKVINPGFVETPLTDKNDFAMPMIIKADAAAKLIVKGLQSRSFEIHFPKKFTWIMKTLRILPSALYFWISRKINDRNK